MGPSATLTVLVELGVALGNQVRPEGYTGGSS